MECLIKFGLDWYSMGGDPHFVYNDHVYEFDMCVTALTYSHRNRIFVLTGGYILPFLPLIQNGSLSLLRQCVADDIKELLV